MAGIFVFKGVGLTAVRKGSLAGCEQASYLCQSDRHWKRHVSLIGGKDAGNVNASPCWLSSVYALALQPVSR